MVQTILPRGLREWFLRKRFGTCHPPVGWVRFGSLRRVKPISDIWGNDRGRPIDRYYIESFLNTHAADVRGRVLEVEDNAYTMRFGENRVTKSDILHATSDNPRATIIGDLANADNIPSETFDCIILTQVMQYIFDARSAVKHLHRILKPGGVVLATLPCIEKISLYDDAKWGDYWRFTVRSGEALFAEAFGPANVKSRGYGNVLVAASSLMGLSQEELRIEELDALDPKYPLTISVRAVKRDVGQ
jgi:SAM-dependent methyltransferase